MRETHDDFMLEFVERGREAFTDFLETGKVNTRSLAQFIGRTFADLAYKKYLAQSVASLGDLLFSSLAGLFSPKPHMPDDVPTRGGKALGGSVKAGRIYPVNEFDTGGPGELLTTAGGGQYLMARRDGYVTPRGGAGGRGSGGTVIQIHQPIHVNPVQGVSMGQLYATVEAGVRAGRAQMMDELVRHGDFRRAVESY